ncbi:hypothetical protein CO172_03360 [Candidatus Uhrbacteria bacterium CG_4_9_14_3_um_filter_36_7]|uniref:Undecaprenyl-phosphate alpha-N-acetylglucosaminyl 1-phosphate transferase n=1 Tax=Candidatus Uhrbacteria bacterium CG_4_9_14_3_um_filter_36_7 TaxID=1975033 RepID=A0A2M7XGI6_9BACT|nr:MAG: hypothetical protein CO172_03360 [Candidatus Uhrbacteria bacterium CG_4_9_14_3_um_filter_36_7]
MFDSRFIWFIISFFLCFLLTKLVIYLGKKWGLVDRPDEHKKNIHKNVIPLGGGLSIFLSILGSFLFLLFLGNTILISGSITIVHYSGFFLGGLILILIGLLDDWFDLPPYVTILGPILAAFIVILFGVNIEKLTNPFGGVIYLGFWQSNILVFLWLLVVMYSMKLIDGLDGLETGVASIATFMILALSSTVSYFQPDVQIFSSVVLGAFLGFFVFNFYPAKIFLGEGGSTFIAYTIGVLAIISGGKVATALLVLCLPFFDLIWVMGRRFFKGGFYSMFEGDRQHLHHRLFDLGWTQKQVVFFYYIIAASLGASALFLQSFQKLLVLSLFILFMVCFAFWFVMPRKNKKV